MEAAQRPQSEGSDAVVCDVPERSMMAATCQPEPLVSSNDVLIGLRKSQKSVGLAFPCGEIQHVPNVGRELYHLGAVACWQRAIVGALTPRLNQAIHVRFHPSNEKFPDHNSDR